MSTFIGLQIITLLDMYPDLSGLSLVFEYMPFTLYSKLKDEDNPMSRQEIQSYMKMLLKGLMYLHDLRIMHRVIPPIVLYVQQFAILSFPFLRPGYQTRQFADKRVPSAQDRGLWPRKTL